MEYYHAALLDLTPPLRTSASDVRNKTGVVGVSLERQTQRSGTTYVFYRAVWPKPKGGYKKRAFSLKRYGKRVAFRLAVEARRQGLAQLEDALRTEIEIEIARRQSQRRSAGRRRASR